MSTAEPPAWLPDEYDPDAPLRERLPAIADIEGGIELHVQGETAVVEIVGSPVHFDERANGVMVLMTGTRSCSGSWQYEIVVPEDEGRARLRKADPDQDVEAYMATRKTWLRGVDVRVYGVDADRFDDDPAAFDSEADS